MLVAEGLWEKSPAETGGHMFVQWQITWYGEFLFFVLNSLEKDMKKMNNLVAQD